MAFSSICGCGFDQTLPLMDHQQLQTYLSHAAAWVAKMFRNDPSGAEPLWQELGSGRLRICPCLMKSESGWDRLKQALWKYQCPPKTLGSAIAEKLGLEETSPKCRKGLQLMQKAIQIWKNEASSTRSRYVEKLEEELKEVKDDLCGGQKWLRSIFGRAVAALSPPRLAGSEDAEDELSGQHHESSRVLLASKFLPFHN